MAHSLVMGDNKLALLEWVCDHGFQFSRSDIAVIWVRTNFERKVLTAYTIELELD